MVVIIGTDAEPLCVYLQENGVQAAAFDPSHVPSLTAFLLTRPEITDVVLLEEKNWSMGHILSAAKQLESKGRMVFLGSYEKLPPLISIAADKEQLAQLLKKPVKPASGSGAGGKVQRFLRGSQSSPELTRKPDIRPLAVPAGKILFIGVIGSQHRIGCTTQAVGLWHYCKALGFDPAVVAGQEQLAQLAAPMHSQEIPGGYKIEGIPFITNTALSYDCYILDIGPGSMQEAMNLSDCLVLVAGSKPWELQNTAAALRAAKGTDLLIFLSFSTQSDGEALRPLFGRQAAAILPWMPELWQPSAPALAIYDALLRPMLSRELSKELIEEEPEIQLSSKGDA